MNHVQTKEKRNVQARLFHGNMLKDVDLMSRGDIKQCADFPLADHVVVVGAAGAGAPTTTTRSEEHTSELQSRLHLVCRLLLEKKKTHSYTLQHRLQHYRSYS